MEEKKRISLLDGFRSIAIIMVIMHHYASIFPREHIANFKKEFYLYTYAWWDGQMGVELFFIISGFVIYMTLAKCSSIKEFLIKRFIRLYPLLLVASIITFIAPFILDRGNAWPILHVPVRSFFPSLTFTDPWLSKIIFHQNTEYIDNVYWSLVMEVKFYLFSAILYFINKKNFFKNWLIFTFFSVILFAVALQLNYESVSKALELLIISNQIIFFTLGMYFYLLFESRKINYSHTLQLFILLLVHILFIWTLHQTCYFLAFILLFFLFIFKQNWLSFLSNKIIVTIGVISYPLYLLHNNIGKLIIVKISSYFSFPPIYWPLIIMVTVLMILISYLVHNYCEVPLGKWCKKTFLSVKANS